MLAEVHGLPLENEHLDSIDYRTHSVPFSERINAMEIWNSKKYFVSQYNQKLWRMFHDHKFQQF